MEGIARGAEGHPNRPLVSIVISNFNGAGYVRRCLNALRNLNYPAVEIIVIDAGSADDSVAILQSEFPAVRVVQAGRIGIGEAVNIGIRVSRGDLLLLDYNIDEMAAPVFLDRLVDVLQSSAAIGAVGGTRLVDGTADIVDSMGGIVYLAGYYPRIGHGLKYSDIAHEPFEVDYLGHVLVRRNLLAEVGLFDEDFYVYGEDTDFCIRIRRGGYRILQVPAAVTYHAGSGTVGQGSVRYVYFFERAHMRLVLKHCPVLWLPIGLTLTVLVRMLYMALRLPIFRRAISHTSWAYLASRGSRSHLRAVIDGTSWNVKNLSQTLASRRRMARRVGHPRSING
jgi:GT2 family glycosyltransferase